MADQDLVTTALSAQHVNARVEWEDGRPVLVLDDGETTIRVETAVGDRELAADRLVRLASTALAAAASLHSGTGPVQWWRPGRG